MDLELARDVPRDPGRPRHRQAGVHGVVSRRRGHRRGRREGPEGDPQGARRPRGRLPGLPGAQARVRARAAGALLRQGGRRFMQALYRAFERRRLLAGRDQPVPGHEGRRAARARREDELRRQRALPPPGPARAARPRRGGPARGRGLEVQPELHQARRRQHRLHGERRRPGDGDDGHHQAGRRRAGQLPRRRRRRQRRADPERVPHPARRPGT